MTVYLKKSRQWPSPVDCRLIDGPVESNQDEEGGGEAGGRILESQEVNICDLINELGETNNQISELLSSGTANLPETSDVDEGDEEQGSGDENDLLVCFGSLGKQLKTFQRDLTRADKKVESAKKVSSPLRKKRKKQC